MCYLRCAWKVLVHHQICHLLFGEMTLKPIYLVMLMGLGFTGELLIYQEDFYTDCDKRLHLSGPIVELIPHEDHFSYNVLIDLMCDDD